MANNKIVSISHTSKVNCDQVVDFSQDIAQLPLSYVFNYAYMVETRYAFISEVTIIYYSGFFFRGKTKISVMRDSSGVTGVRGLLNGIAISPCLCCTAFVPGVVVQRSKINTVLLPHEREREQFYSQFPAFSFVSLSVLDLSNL